MHDSSHSRSRFFIKQLQEGMAPANQGGSRH